MRKSCDNCRNDNTKLCETCTDGFDEPLNNWSPKRIGNVSFGVKIFFALSISMVFALIL